jgi:beta-glucosidase
MWDTNFLHMVADNIATEARAMNRMYTEHNNGDSVQYTGLNFWTPNINIFRDPRWGRGQETYGEDPFLTARTAVAFITGLQGDDPTYVKAMACAKHFAVHSGPEVGRYSFDVSPKERDLYETYLPQFEAAVREAHVGAVMAAYNSVFGVPASCDKFLLTDLLRTKWGFDGHVVSDCGAINWIYRAEGHNYLHDTNEESGMDKAEGASVQAGCDLGCWGGPAYLVNAVRLNLLTEQQLNVSVGRVLAARFRLGLFDPPARVKYAQIPTSDHDTAAQDALALEAARKSIVLLKNDGLLPLDKAKYRHIAIFGMNSTNFDMLLGEYNGFPSREHTVPIIAGIARALGVTTAHRAFATDDTNAQIVYAPGCSVALPQGGSENYLSERMARSNAVAIAKDADLIIYVGGISALLESEFRDVYMEGFLRGDRTRIELPATQTALLKELKATGKPLVFVNCSGSAIAMPWEAENVPAILQAWYPGQEGGAAVADVLFGNVNPAGRLPVTFYRSTEDLPDYTNYDMANRTYRYFTGKPLFAFGHGLSYTKFDYKSVKCDKPEAAPADTIKVTLDLANTGERDGDEVVQVYFRHVNSAVPQPLEALCGFQRVTVAKGQTKTVEIAVPLKELRYWDTTKKDYVVEAGKYELLVGAASDDIRARVPLSVSAAR